MRLLPDMGHISSVDTFALSLKGGALGASKVAKVAFSRQKFASPRLFIVASRAIAHFVGFEVRSSNQKEFFEYRSRFRN